MSDPLLTVCPECGQSTYTKQVTAAGFQLKGSGWYVTDFRNNGSNGATGAPVAGTPAAGAPVAGAPAASASSATASDSAKGTASSGDSGAASSPSASAPAAAPAPPTTST